jgi:hypothetical protein
MIMGRAIRTSMTGIGREHHLVSQGVPSGQESNTMLALAYGTMPDEHVSDALMRLMPLCEQDWTTIIRSIDSCRSLDGLVRILAFHHMAHKVVHRNVCLSMSELQKALDAGVFTGFDEVWIVSGRPPAFELSQLPSATSDGTQFSGGMPEGLAEAVEKTACVLILGNGCGLNYATSNERIRQEMTQGNKSA